MYFKLITILLLYSLLAACDLFEVRAPIAVEGESTNQATPGANQENGSTNISSPETAAASANEAAAISEPLVSANDSLLAMLRYDRYLGTLHEQAREQEYKRMHDAYFIRPNERTRLKLAMLLALPESKFADHLQAKQLLNEVKNDKSADPAIAEFAHYLLERIADYEQSLDKYSQLADKLKQEQLKRKKIEEQLEALKSIEQSITQRQNGTTGK